MTYASLQRLHRVVACLPLIWFAAAAEAQQPSKELTDLQETAAALYKSDDFADALETLSLMSDVEIPIYVARAQVASAIHLIVQLSRFSEDGSRRITRITEACGLEGDKYTFRDLFILKMHGKTRAGRLVAELEPTGTLPTFSREAYEQGMDDRIKLTGALWQK